MQKKQILLKDPGRGHAARQAGVTVMLVLVFMGIFTLLLAGLSGYVFTESRIGRANYARETSFQAAEAGLEYYRWFLAHNQNNLTNGTGNPGPYVQNVTDSDGNTVGSYSLAIAGNSSCGTLQSIDITSTGSSAADPTFKRVLQARYAKPSVAEYAYIINSDVWAGADRVITGPYQVNGGIRMDGTNNSIVSSSVNTWTCTASFGCSPNQIEPGVFGAGSGSALWKYPVPQVDFAGIASNFTTLKSLAQTSGVYFPSIGVSDQTGYHVIMKSNNTFDVYTVTKTSSAKGLHIDDMSAYQDDYDTITAQTFKGNYAIPSSCSVIFFENKVWLEGTVSGKVTLIAAAPSSSYSPDIILNNNITYTTADGTVGLTAIAEHSIRIPLHVPHTMAVRGIFIAQTGYFGRDLYTCTYAPDDELTQLSVAGTVVSNLRVGTQWSYSQSGCSGTSGFDTRLDSYDKVLAQSPPPFTPAWSPTPFFVVWKEQ
jgi:hypothetical protein